MFDVCSPLLSPTSQSLVKVEFLELLKSGFFRVFTLYRMIKPSMSPSLNYPHTQKHLRADIKHKEDICSYSRTQILFTDLYVKIWWVRKYIPQKIEDL